jgi:hypothetical protein
MARMPTRKPDRCNRTICLPIDEPLYGEVMSDVTLFRQWLAGQYELYPELFPDRFAGGFSMKDRRTSARLGIEIRRVTLRDGSDWSVRPSFVLPGMVARTEDVEHALFLRKFAVPFWALAHVFGRNAMFWYRLQSSPGRNSLAGTTVRKGSLPQDLLADEHHQKRDGEKTYSSRG